MSARGGQSRTRRVVLLALTATCCTALSAATAGAASVTEAQSEPTADPSTSVKCPAGTHVISGGGQASSGGGETALTESFKARNGWRVSAYGSTSLIAYAYCTKHDYDLVTRKTDWVITSDPMTVKCPSGTQIVSGGGGIQNGENLGALSRIMRKRNGWIADASGIGPHSARAYCTAERLKLEWTTSPDQPVPLASAVCETGVAFSGGGMARQKTGGLYETRRISANQWGVAGFSLDGLTAQVGCH